MKIKERDSWIDSKLSLEDFNRRGKKKRNKEKREEKEFKGFVKWEGKIKTGQKRRKSKKKYSTKRRKEREHEKMRRKFWKRIERGKWKESGCKDGREREREEGRRTTEEKRGNEQTTNLEVVI